MEPTPRTRRIARCPKCTGATHLDADAAAARGCVSCGGPLKIVEELAPPDETYPNGLRLTLDGTAESVRATLVALWDYAYAAGLGGVAWTVHAYDAEARPVRVFAEVDTRPRPRPSSAQPPVTATVSGDPDAITLLVLGARELAHDGKVHGVDARWRDFDQDGRCTSATVTITPRPIAKS